MNLQEVNLVDPFNINTLQNDPPATPIDLVSGDEPLTANWWGFPYFSWYYVQEEFETVQKLYAAIQDIHDEIKKCKETFREQAIDLPDLICEYNREGGVSGSYFLVDNEGDRKYVLKPLDEDAGCINSKHYASPFHMSPFRDDMPLYLSSMREVLAYQVAKMIGTSSIIPKTSLTILDSANFHDLSDSIMGLERNRYFENCGFPDREKLCSVQEYVPNSKSLFEAIHDFEKTSLTDEEIAARIDQKDFEEMNILIWTTYDTDAHLGNILVYPKGVDSIGNEILGLKKIDNGLAFPDKNTQLRNNLTYLPNAKMELSDEAKAKILAIDVDQLVEQFEKMGLSSATEALKERIPLLKELAEREGITIKKINKELSKIGKKQ